MEDTVQVYTPMRTLYLFLSFNHDISYHKKRQEDLSIPLKSGSIYIILHYFSEKYRLYSKPVAEPQYYLKTAGNDFQKHFCNADY